MKLRLRTHFEGVYLLQTNIHDKTGKRFGAQNLLLAVNYFPFWCFHNSLRGKGLLASELVFFQQKCWLLSLFFFFYIRNSFFHTIWKTLNGVNYHLPCFAKWEKGPPSSSFTLTAFSNKVVKHGRGTPRWADGFIHPHARCLIYFWSCVYVGVHTGSPGRAALTRCRLLFVQLAHLASDSIVQILHRAQLCCHRQRLCICGYGFAAGFFFFLDGIIQNETFYLSWGSKKRQFCARVAEISARSVSLHLSGKCFRALFIFCGFRNTWTLCGDLPLVAAHAGKSAIFKKINELNNQAWLNARLQPDRFIKKNG